MYKREKQKQNKSIERMCAHFFVSKHCKTLKQFLKISALCEIKQLLNNISIKAKHK